MKDVMTASEFKAKCLGMMDSVAQSGRAADRFIAASALAWSAALVTTAERLLALRHELPRQDARQ